MFAPFSSGYYLGRLYVQPHAGDRPAMHREQHEHVVAQLYDDEDGPEPGPAAVDVPGEEPPERVTAGDDTADDDRPLVMKIGGTHIPVHGETGVPEGTVALPADWLEATRVKNPPTLTEVLLAKRERMDQLLAVADDARSART
jgi:hypothetical protein